MDSPFWRGKTTTLPLYICPGERSERTFCKYRPRGLNPNDTNIFNLNYLLVDTVKWTRSVITYINSVITSTPRYVLHA